MIGLFSLSLATTTSPAGLPLWFPVAFIALWVAVGGLLAELEGWPAVAKQYRAGRRPEGRRLRGQVVQIGSVSENNITVLIPTAAGLYLCSNPLFRFRRPPLLLPWAAIHYRGERKVLWSRTHMIDAAGLTIRMRDRGYRGIQPYLDTAH